LHAGSDVRGIEAAAVAGELALDHRLSLHWDSDLIQSTRSALRIAGQVK
jgi:hypothetical protein